MLFLKKHYEKIVLAVLLCVFIFSIIYQIKIITTALEVKPEDLKLPPKKADYQAMNFEDAQFTVLETLGATGVWSKSEARNKDDKFFTDLMIPFEAARSPASKKIIAMYYFTEGVDPYTGGKITAADDKPPPTNDEDNDGIPDDVEIQAGMNPKEASDAQDDFDDDGFSNAEEYAFGGREAMLDAKAHPPVIKRMYVARIDQPEIEICPKSIREVGQGDSKRWDLRISHKSKGKMKEDFFKIGDEISVENEKYKILGATARFKKEYDKTLKADRNVDKSFITVESPGGETIEIVVNELGKSLKKKIIFKDGKSGQTVSAFAGDKFTAGDDQIGREEYEVKELGDDGVVKVLALASKKTYDVSRKKPDVPKKGASDKGRAGKDPGAPPMLPDDMDPFSPKKK